MEQLRGVLGFIKRNQRVNWPIQADESWRKQSGSCCIAKIFNMWPVFIWIACQQYLQYTWLEWIHKLYVFLDVFLICPWWLSIGWIYPIRTNQANTYIWSLKCRFLNAWQQLETHLGYLKIHTKQTNFSRFGELLTLLYSFFMAM